MKTKVLFLISFLTLLSACGVSGNYRNDGPCKGFNKNPQACERAAANSLVIGEVQLGQTFDEVRKIMGNEPERRDVTENSEIWGYRTEYDTKRFTELAFKNGRVASIKQYAD